MSFDYALLALIGELYEAATDQTKWAAIAPRLAAAFNAESCVLQSHDGRRGTVEILGATDNFGNGLVHEYVDHYHRIDEWALRAVSLSRDIPRLGEELISRSEIDRIPFHDWCRKLGTFHLVGALITVGETDGGIIGIHRADSEFDEDSRQRLGLVVPHFRRALQINRELTKGRLERDVALQGLEGSAIATLLVDPNARVLFANSLAEQLLRDGDGIVERHGKLGARLSSATASLHSLIAGAARTSLLRDHHPGGALPLPREDRRPLMALVSPMRGGAFQQYAHLGLAVVLVRDPERVGAGNEAVLAALFALTRSEARLASALADGLSLDEFAERKSVSMNTVRSQLKSVMQKTDTNRQGELISLLLRSTATARGAER